MKKIKLIIPILITVIHLGFGQNNDKYSVEEIVKKQSIYLNSYFGGIYGQSYTYVQLDFPPHTKKWYYSFTTKKGKGGTKNINLATQLASLYFDPSGTSSQLISAIDIPEGENNINTYLTDKTNYDKYVAGKTFSYFIEGSTKKLKQGILKIDDILSGTYYLIVENQSYTSGVYIEIEAAAIKIKNPIEYDKAAALVDLSSQEIIKQNYKKCIELCDTSQKSYKFSLAYANEGLAQLALNEKDKAYNNYSTAIALAKEEKREKKYFQNLIGQIEILKEGSWFSIDGADEIINMIKLNINS